jgi:uncharacterized protein YjiS (DUF1127 family)
VRGALSLRGDRAVTNVHTYMDACDQRTPAYAPKLMDAIESERVSATELAGGLFAKFQLRWTTHHIARLSDHRLQDMGFERDRDGSVIPRQR